MIADEYIALAKAKIESMSKEEFLSLLLDSGFTLSDKKDTKSVYQMLFEEWYKVQYADSITNDLETEDDGGYKSARADMGWWWFMNGCLEMEKYLEDTR